MSKFAKCIAGNYFEKFNENQAQLSIYGLKQLRQFVRSFEIEIQNYIDFNEMLNNLDSFRKVKETETVFLMTYIKNYSSHDMEDEDPFDYYVHGDDASGSGSQAGGLKNGVSQSNMMKGLFSGSSSKQN